jgi:hypothetical protein
MSRVPSDEPVVEHHWVTSEWGFCGNGREDPMAGSCGSPVLDEDGYVAGFFRFVDSSGLAVRVAATTLQTWGYKAV